MTRSIFTTVASHQEAQRAAAAAPKKVKHRALSVRSNDTVINPWAPHADKRATTRVAKSIPTRVREQRLSGPVSIYLGV